MLIVIYNLLFCTFKLKQGMDFISGLVRTLYWHNIHNVSVSGFKTESCVRYNIIMINYA